MSNILFIGRFQPLHNGHLKVVQQIVTTGGKAIIGIGSAQYKDTMDNPFSAETRAEMIEAALVEAGIAKERYRIISIDDIHDNEKWPMHVLACVGEQIDEVWSGRPLVQELFRQYTSLPVKELPRFDGLSASRIRKKMTEDDASWAEDVPPAVAKRMQSVVR